MNATYHDACSILLDRSNNQAPLPAIKHNVKQQQKHHQQLQNNNKRIIGNKVQQYICFSQASRKPTFLLGRKFCITFSPSLLHPWNLLR